MLMRGGIKPEKGRTVNPKPECRTSVAVPWFGVPRLRGPLQTPPPDRLKAELQTLRVLAWEPCQDAPRVHRHNGYEREFQYVYGAVSPLEGELDWRICP